MAPKSQPETDRGPVFTPDRIVSGRYRIVRFINCGGMGEVYEAEDLELHEHIALKTLRPEIGGESRNIARFKQEIQLARKVAHPNVCRVFDLGHHPAGDTSADVVYFLTMELLPGETLEARLHRAGPMALAEALPLIEQMAAALDAAHHAGIIHRDFKPSNVMLAPECTHAVVTDFGLARASVLADTEACTKTMTRQVMGTPGYMAPEILLGGAATIASDVYALGVTVYRMLGGVLPAGPEIDLPGLPPRWARAIRRSLERDPSRRFPGAGEFVEAIRGPVQAGRAISRRKLFAAAAMALLLLAAWWFGWKAWQTWRAQPSPEAMKFYRTGTDDLHAMAYFAATKALEQAVRMAPHYSLAHARLAEAQMELELPERAGVEMLIARREGTAGLSSFDRLQMDAVELSVTREFDTAVAKYQQMLRSAGSGKADVYIDLGRTYERAERNPKALENYVAAAKFAPGNPAVWLRLARLHSQASQWAQARDEFRRAEELYQVVSNYEGLTEVAYQRGVDANHRQRLDEAAEYTRKALETARLTGNLHQEIRAKLQLGDNAFRSGDSALAERQATEALEMARANHIESLAIRGILVLGNAYRRKRDFVNAEEYGRQALSMARRDGSRRLAALSLLALAGLHAEQSRPEAAEEAAEALAFFEPNRYARESLQGIILLGRAQRDRGDPAALESFGRALQMAQKLGDSSQIILAHASMGSLLASQDRLPDALAHYAESLRLGTTAQQVGYAALECAEVLWPMGRYEEARRMFDKAAENAVKFPALQLSIAGSRAEMLLSQGRYMEAITLCSRTLAASPEPAETAKLTQILGSAQVASGKKQQGRRNCEAALALAEKLGGISALIVARTATAEARLEAGDTAAASALLHTLEPAVEKLPLSKWYVLALQARADRAHARESARAAKQQLDEIARQWGAPAFQLYTARPDLAAALRAVARFSQEDRP